MSQTIVPAAPSAGSSVAALDPDGGAPDGTLRARLSAADAALRHALSGTPGRLRVVCAVAVLAALVLTIGGGAALRERSSAINAAADASEHLVLLQRVQTNLVQADAAATNAFLNYGSEPHGQLVDYNNSIKAASGGLATAASASQADAEALSRSNTGLARYTGYIASARANNLLGYPVGASYLSTASLLMQSDILPPLKARSTADQKAIESAYSRSTHAGWWLALIAVIGLAGLIWAQLYLARHSRRILNVPLAASTVGLLVVLLIAGGAMLSAQSKAETVRTGALDRTTKLSASRVAAFNAKSSESLTLINRGSGSSADEPWTTLMAGATSNIPPGNGSAAEALSAYAMQHKAIRALDDVGNWQQARLLAIATKPGSANAEFTSYANQTAAALSAQAEQTKSGLGNAGTLLLPAGILVVLMGLLAAIGALWGVSLRLDEYR